MRILFFSDIHFDISNKKHYPATAEVLPVFWEFLSREKGKFDLAILGGDLTVRGPGCIDELKAFKEEIDRLDIPYQALPGNHDLAPHRGYAAMYPGMEDYEEVPLEGTNFGKVFSEEGLRYFKKYPGITLIGFALRDNDPDGQLDWIRDKLKTPGEKLVFCHYPLVPARDGGFCSNWEYKRVGGVIKDLSEMLGDPGNNVLAYFCGHLHINSKRAMGNCVQIVNGATGLSTVCYKEILVKDNRIEVNTLRLPGFDGLYGKIMNEDNSVDKFHMTLEEYHWGTEEETNFIISRKVF